MSKLFQKTISLTFTVEHVSDDPNYEAELTKVVEDLTSSNDLCNSFIGLLFRRGLHKPIVAGGWDVLKEGEK
jgi:hypothetical protein